MGFVVLPASGWDPSLPLVEISELTEYSQHLKEILTGEQQGLRFLGILCCCGQCVFLCFFLESELASSWLHVETYNVSSKICVEAWIHDPTVPCSGVPAVRSWRTTKSKWFHLESGFRQLQCCWRDVRYSMWGVVTRGEKRHPIFPFFQCRLLKASTLTKNPFQGTHPFFQFPQHTQRCAETFFFAPPWPAHSCYTLSWCVMWEHSSSRVTPGL